MSSPQIYTGPWINRSHGLLRGATITLTTRDAAFLLAFLAVIVTAAGQSFWMIASYAVHQTRSKPGPHDALFYQQQAVLKNSNSPFGAVWSFLKISFSWRKHTRSKWWRVWQSRTFFFIVLGLTIGAVFSVASIFSSRVTSSAGSQVLISSPNCGFWSFPNFTTTDETSLYNYDLKTLNESIAIQSYANDCYRTDNSNKPQCHTYPVPEISWNTTNNVSCPFDPKTCALSPTMAVQLDTGPLDSNNIFGLNAVESERVTIRKIATCAPLHLLPYGTLVNTTVGGRWLDTFLVVDIGDPGIPGQNFTYEYNTHAAWSGFGYNLDAIGTGSGWTPISDFARADADISIFFFEANSVDYTYSNNDPLFSATTPVPGLNRTYWPDILLTSLGCIDQYQVCNPSLPLSTGCTLPTSLSLLIKDELNIGLNVYQSATVETLVMSMETSSMVYAVYGRGSQALKATSTVFDLLQVAQLPNNQWVNEIEGWFAFSLASVQQALSEKASGPTGVTELGGYIIHPSNAEEKALCERQMIQNVSGYQNFSTLGIGIILIIGLVIIVMGFAIDGVVGWWQERLLGKRYKKLAWASDGYLQMLRLAYEGAGYAGWENCDAEVPVGKEKEKVMRLGGLDDGDKEHPSLVKASEEVEEVDGDSMQKLAGAPLLDEEGEPAEEV